MAEEVEIRERLDALLAHWRERHAYALAAYEQAADAHIESLDPHLRQNLDQAAGAVAALAMLASGRLPSDETAGLPGYE